MPEETPEEKRERVKDEVEGMTDYELIEGLKHRTEALRASGFLEAYIPRIYVYFQQRIEESPVDAEGVSRPEKITFGPYLAVEIVDDEMQVEDSEGEHAIGSSFHLATREGDSWVVHDGSEETGTRYGRVRIHTTPPLADCRAAKAPSGE